ncbi:MAG: YggS family pyridoxal phosphate-dependent enzyme [Oscillospiraceae bacterium]|nr:YggS family pyridoxal phosphate-dependent enzyme [Oscillospiraceae bacterium]
MTERSLPSDRLTAVEENLKRVRFEIEQAAIKAGRDPSEVKLMAVTKTVGPELINHAIRCGVDMIGENKVQELLSKKPLLSLTGCETHLIGHLQTNKVKQVAGEVSMIQSVDSVKLAREIGRISCQKGIAVDVLLEINIGGEESKFGFTPEELPEIVWEISEIQGINVQGLMTVPPFVEKISEFFSNMCQVFIDIREKKIHNIDMQILSMGMSGDFPEAIAEGSTLVRVGSAIFGQRVY